MIGHRERKSQKNRYIFKAYSSAWLDRSHGQKTEFGDHYSRKWGGCAG